MLSARAKSRGGWIVFAIILSMYSIVVGSIGYAVVHFVIKYW